DEWMQRQECLRVKRHFGERIVWEADRSVASVVRRAVSGKGDALVRANDVAATAIAVEGSRVLVRLDAYLGSHRASMAQVNAGLAGPSVVAGGIPDALGVPVLAAVAAAGLLVPAGRGPARPA